MNGDAQLVRAAAENVIRNALNHTEEGTSVDVTLKLVSGTHNETAVIRVRDRGKGVPEESLMDIFLPFYRVGDARERSAGGSGLGLSITDRAVRLHGGSVKAENCKDGGLVVELGFPALANGQGTCSGRYALNVASLGSIGLARNQLSYCLSNWFSTIPKLRPG